MQIRSIASMDAVVVVPDNEKSSLCNMEWMRRKRISNPYYRIHEKAKNKERMRKKRYDAKFRVREKEKGKERKRLLRSNPQYLVRERDQKREQRSCSLNRTTENSRRKERLAQQADDRKEHRRLKDRDRKRLQRLAIRKRKREYEMKKKWDTVVCLWINVYLTLSPSLFRYPSSLMTRIHSIESIATNNGVSEKQKGKERERLQTSTTQHLLKEDFATLRRQKERVRKRRQRFAIRMRERVNKMKKKWDAVVCFWINVNLMLCPCLFRYLLRATTTIPARDPHYRIHERAKNRERMRKKRFDATYRVRENVKGKERKRLLRANPHHVAREKTATKNRRSQLTNEQRRLNRINDNDRRRKQRTNAKIRINREWLAEVTDRKRQRHARKERDRKRGKRSNPLHRTTENSRRRERLAQETEDRKQLRKRRDRDRKRRQRHDIRKRKRENEMKKEWDALTRRKETYTQKNKRRLITLRRYREKRCEARLGGRCTRSVRRSPSARPYQLVRNPKEKVVRVANLKSRYIKNILRGGTEQETLMSIVLHIVKNFPDYVYMMMPDRSRRNVRMSIQFPQAMRIFYGKSSPLNRFFDQRPAYGLTSILRSTGMRPFDLRVRPFTEEIIALIAHLQRAVEPRLVGTRYEKCQFDFNFLEVKLYLGEKLVERNSTTTVGAHTDCVFDDNGQQSPNDSSRGDHLTMILTFGYPRELFFVRCSKNTIAGNGSRGWIEERRRNDFVGLEHNSLFVLFPDDEKPAPLVGKEHILHKTKHGVRFNGKRSPFSVALVFRSVKKSAAFHRTAALPKGMIPHTSPASMYKKDSWCWTKVEGMPGTENNTFAEKFVTSPHNELAFAGGDNSFDNSLVMACANKMLNEVRKFAHESKVQTKP